METTAVAVSEVDIEGIVQAIDKITLDGMLGSLAMLFAGLVIIRIVMTIMGRVIKKLPPENKALMNFLR